MVHGRRVARLLLVSSICIAVLSVASSVRATSIPVRGGSNYGSADGLASGDFNACLTGNTAVTLGDACEAFNLSTGITVTLNGTTYNVDQFVFGDGTDPGTVFDVVDIGLIAPGTTFSFSGIFTPLNTEVFSCDDHIDLFNASNSKDFNTNVTDSGSSSMVGPCTSGLTAAPDLSQDGTSFTTGPNFNVSDLVLDASAPATVATPEPGTLMLLGTGIAAFIGLRRRKQ